eukprot:3502215-Amphidinium_carterae.1
MVSLSGLVVVKAEPFTCIGGGGLGAEGAPNCAPDADDDDASPLGGGGGGGGGPPGAPGGGPFGFGA